MVLIPAYGRDYETAEEAKQAFLNGQDFKQMGMGSRGTYASVRDFKDKWITIRFNKLMDSIAIKT